MINEIINEIINLEGGYVDDPDDSGGETNYGITIKVARNYGYTSDMCDLPRTLAFNIYADRYWHSVNADKLNILSTMITREIVDTGVNMGIKRAGNFLQRSLNVLNNRGRLYSDIKIDGSIGPATLHALERYLSKRDEKILYKMLNCLQGAFFVELGERREKDEKFMYGWFKNRVVL